MAYTKTTWVNDETDVDATNMNHIEDGIEKAYGVELLAVVDTAPSECSTGDKYFNSTTNKIYTATATDTWSSDGEDAESGVFYVVFEERAVYTYNGTTLIGVGSSGAGGESLPIGVILAFGGTNAPNGYLLCNGQEVSRTTYTDLFSVIGTTYGQGDGTTTFNLPNIKGKVLVGRDANDNDFYALGDTGGEKKHTLTKSELPNIQGTLPHTAFGESKLTGVFSINQGGTSNYEGEAGSTQNNNRYLMNFGSNQAHNNLQPYIVVNYIIKASAETSTSGTIVDSLSGSSTTDAPSVHIVKDALSSKLDTSAVKTSSTTSGTNTYSCTYSNNNFQPKLKTTTKQLTTDSAGNASLGMTANDYLVLSVTQKGTTFNCWTSLYCYGTQYHVHTAALETGNAVSGTGTYEIVYIERANM